MKSFKEHFKQALNEDKKMKDFINKKLFKDRIFYEFEDIGNFDSWRDSDNISKDEIVERVIRNLSSQYNITNELTYKAKNGDKCLRELIKSMVYSTPY